MSYTEVSDAELVALLPPARAREATVMIRRLSMMRHQVSGAHSSQYYALRDVNSLQSVLDALQSILQEEESEQVLKVHFQNNDEDEED